jgi:hypothetical protein
MSISNANPSVATFTRYRYVAVGAETSISGADANGNVMSYSPGREQVYLNGTMLVRASDYAATTGSSITDLTALVENDVVEVLAFTSFAVAAGVAQDEAPSSPAEGQLWLDTNGTVPGVQITRWSKAPSTGATSLSGNDDNSLPLAYTAGYETVYRNGVLLSRGNDYTATDGTSITLIDATLAGDIIEVFGPSAIGFADTYTQSQANSTFIAKSLTTTTGDIIYASAANTPARLGIGSTDQVLKVSGGIPAWATPAAGGANWSIVNSGGTALTGAQTITVSGISGADKLMVIVNKGSAGANAFINIRFNSDSGNNYWLASGNQTGSTTGFKESDGSPQIEFANLSSNASSQFSGFLELSGGNAAGTKAFTTASGADAAGGTGNKFYSGGGLWLNSATITSVSIISTVGNFDNGNIYVYTSA